MALTTVPVELANLDGAVTVNESSADVDFRVESNDNANMLVVDAGTNAVGVGVSPSGATFHVVSSGSGVKARFSDNTSETLDIGITENSHAYFNQANSGPIAFQIGGTEEMRVTSNGLTFNGDTAAANALDDYEEGTWTPAVAAGGWSIGTTVLANYTKVGKVVHVQCYTSITGSGNSDDLAISGLPFDVPANTYAVNKLDAEKVNTHGAYVRTAPNTDDVNFLTSEESTSSGRTNLDGNEFGAGYLIFSITYFAS